MYLDNFFGAFSAIRCHVQGWQGQAGHSSHAGGSTMTMLHPHRSTLAEYREAHRFVSTFPSNCDSQDLYLHIIHFYGTDCYVHPESLKGK